MSGPPARGDVVEYPYLWRWQQRKGEESGRKPRPVCVAIVVEREGKTHLFLAPITSSEPEDDRKALEVPALEAKRGGLRAGRSWIILDEVNYDLFEDSHDYNPGKPRLGRFSDPFTAKILSELQSQRARGRLHSVKRV